MKPKVYEFEVYKDDGWLIAEPFDLDGGTQGEDYEDLCAMVADWLKVTVEDHAIRGIEMPKPTFGNAPRHGGSILLVCVMAGLETVERVSAAEAARMLGVSAGRVSQMLASGQLEGWRDGHSSYVTLDSLRARMAAPREAGRPRAVACA